MWECHDCAPGKTLQQRVLPRDSLQVQLELLPPGITVVDVKYNLEDNGGLHLYAMEHGTQNRVADSRAGNLCCWRPSDSLGAESAHRVLDFSLGSLQYCNGTLVSSATLSVVIKHVTRAQHAITRTACQSVPYAVRWLALRCELQPASC